MNLTGDRMISHGLPSEIVGSTDHDSGQIFSANLYHTRPEVDGIIYPSHLVHDSICLAIYDRAKFKLRAHLSKTLDEDSRTPDIMRNLNIKKDTWTTTFPVTQN